MGNMAGHGQQWGAMNQIGRYRVTRRIGAGAFATVWLAHDTELDVPVAVKVLAENWTADPDTRARFLNEARIMRRLRDPRIVAVHDIGTHGHQPYFVMDLCEAGSLQDVRMSSMATGFKLRLCAEACRAVAVLHEHDIIHRDVTPGNLLLDTADDGLMRVRLADLGVAKMLKERPGQTMAAGTPAFMAPEQARTGDRLSPLADVYSLSGMTYAVLSSRPPFPRQTMLQLVQRPDHVRPAPIAESLGAPPALDDLLAAGLRKDPAARPQSAMDLAMALDRLTDDMGTPPAPVPASARSALPHRSDITPVTPLRTRDLTDMVDLGLHAARGPDASQPPRPPESPPRPRPHRVAPHPSLGEPTDLHMPTAPSPLDRPELTGATNVITQPSSTPSGWELQVRPSERDSMPRWLVTLWIALGALFVIAIALAIHIAFFQ